ncbi:MAG: hypothetical protein HY801_08605 [Candidatus Lindowbacteria bacterium]|nr:hypothetical protein [Candidatus Lindowbacteria bacterium]
MQNEFSDYTTSEWTHEEWERELNLSVGTAYSCEKCGSMIMITKGGVGTLEPSCCGALMKPIHKNRT